MKSKTTKRASKSKAINAMQTPLRRRLRRGMAGVRPLKKSERKRPL